MLLIVKQLEFFFFSTFESEIQKRRWDTNERVDNCFLICFAKAKIALKKQFTAQGVLQIEKYKSCRQPYNE